MELNGAQFHLLVNHLPVVGFLWLLPALVVAIKVQSVEVKRFVLFATVIIGFSALAPFLTGGSAAELVKSLPDITEARIHEHAEAGMYASILSLICAIMAGFALLQQSQRADGAQRMLPLVLLGALVTTAAMLKTAHEGGKIHHQEIRDENPSAHE
jgi:uncharacterized membrane protein